MAGSGTDNGMRRFPRFQRSMLLKINNGSQYTGRTVDVSENGVRIALRRPVTVGQRLKMEVYLQDSDPFPIRFVGECRWCEQSEFEETLAGVDLTHSNSRSLAVWRDYLATAEAG